MPQPPRNAKAATEFPRPGSFSKLGDRIHAFLQNARMKQASQCCPCCSPASETDDLSTCVGRAAFVKSSAACLHEERTCYSLLPVNTYRSHTSVHVLMSQRGKPLLLNMGVTVIFISACSFLSFSLTCVPYIHLCVCAHAMRTTSLASPFT